MGRITATALQPHKNSQPQNSNRIPLYFSQPQQPHLIRDPALFAIVGTKEV